jgi:hypothetical protein
MNSWSRGDDNGSGTVYVHASHRIPSRDLVVIMRQIEGRRQGIARLLKLFSRGGSRATKLELQYPQQKGMYS